MDFTKTIAKLLTGTPQSQYAAIAILIAMIAIILSVLFNENELVLSERFMLILGVILFSIPSIILGLFDLTCVSGKTVENSLCWWWGWVIAFMIIIICVIVVFASISSMLTYNVATVKTTKPVIDETESDKIAKDMVKDIPEIKQSEVPKNNMMEQMIDESPQMFSGMPGSDYAGIESISLQQLEKTESNMLRMETFKNSNKKSDLTVEGFQGTEYGAAY